jgi:predicted small integral membrane protein
MTAEWQAAMLALMLVVELNGPTMMARIGIMRAEAATALRRTYAVFFKNNDYVGGSNVGHD